MLISLKVMPTFLEACEVSPNQTHPHFSALIHRELQTHASQPLWPWCPGACHHLPADVPQVLPKAFLLPEMHHSGELPGRLPPHSSLAKYCLYTEASLSVFFNAAF